MPVCPAGCGRPMSQAQPHCPHLTHPSPWLRCYGGAIIRRSDLKHIDPNPGLYRD